MITALLILTNPLKANVASGNSLEWQFEVFLDKQPIGFHDFTVTTSGVETKIESRAQFDVKLLFVNVFSYRHDNVENWVSNCLSTISSTTTSNGERFDVRGSMSVDGGFQLENTRQIARPNCVTTFAYWDSSFLNSTQLLNPQTGTYESVESTLVGQELFELDTQTVAANKYLLETKDGPISLWYAVDNNRWLGLESIAKGGRVIRYKARSLPATPQQIVSN